MGTRRRGHQGLRIAVSCCRPNATVWRDQENLSRAHSLSTANSAVFCFSAAALEPVVSCA